jgi:hypothetical protein
MADEIERFASIWVPIEAGESVLFGPGVALERERLIVADSEIPLNTLQPLLLNDQGVIVVQQIGAPDPLLTIDTVDLVDVDLLLETANRLIPQAAHPQRPSVTGWSPGSLGDVSARIGYDVRDLRLMGYSDEQIRGVSQGAYTVEDLLKRRPDRGGA